MAFLERSALPTLVLLLVLTASERCVALKLGANAIFVSHFPPLLDCAGPVAPSSRNDDASVYRANVVSALSALPSAAAAAPTGFAATRSGGAGRDPAFARGLCFGFGAPRGGSSPGDCLACLSAAAEDALTGGCGGSRRAGVWRAGCFLSYADTNASSAREDAFRGWFYDDHAGGGPSAALGRQCAGDRAAAECSRCQNASALVVKPRQAEHTSMSIYGDAVVVVGYDCYLRVQLGAQLAWWMNIVAFFLANLTMVIVPMTVIYIRRGILELQQA